MTNTRIVLGVDLFDCLRWGSANPYEGNTSEVWDLRMLKNLHIPAGTDICRTPAYQARPDRDDFEELLPYGPVRKATFISLDNLQVPCFMTVARFMVVDGEFTVLVTFETESGYMITASAADMNTAGEFVTLNGVKILEATPA